MVERGQYLGVEAILASPRMRELLQQVRRFAPGREAVLLVGESGVGKEIIARALHHYSERRLEPFVDLNCAALPGEILESEIFGQPTRPGLMELAQRGSLYLDEVTAMGESAQRKLSELLREGSLSRMAGGRKVRLNIRILAAANPAKEQSGLTRELQAALGKVRIVVPPLRERPEDIEALAVHFLAQQNPEMRLAADAMMALYSYHWPGNVRELRNTVLRSALLAKGPLLHADDLIFSPRATANAVAGVAGVEPALIRRALVDHRGHQQRTADSLGMSRWSLARKMKDYGIVRAAAGGRKTG